LCECRLAHVSLDTAAALRLRWRRSVGCSALSAYFSTSKTESLPSSKTMAEDVSDYVPVEFHAMQTVAISCATSEICVSMASGPSLLARRHFGGFAGQSGSP